MTDALDAAYRATDYRVRLAQGGFATIRIGKLLPPPLCALLRDSAEPWGFITAWSPQSRPQPRTANRRSQRALLATVRNLAPASRIHAGAGVGANGWREPSALVLGLDAAMLDELMLRFDQRACVCGAGGNTAQLRYPPQAPRHNHKS